MKTKEYRLGDVCKLRNGYAFKSENFSNEGVPVIRISNIKSDEATPEGALKTNESSVFEKFRINKGDILIAMSGATTGKFGRYTSDEKAYQNQRVGCFVIQDESKLNIDYLYILLRGLQKKIELDAYGGGQPNISSTIIENYKIQLPPLDDQIRIAAALSKAENLIKRRGKSIDLLNEFLKMRFLKMFIINKSFEDWGGLFKIKNLVEKHKHSIKAGPFGSSLKKEFYVEKGYKIYGQEQVIADDFTIGDYYIDTGLYQKLKSCKIKTGDILISLVGTYGKVSIVPEQFEPGIINPRLMKLSFNKELIHPLYFKYLLRSEYLQIQISKQSRGGTMDIINVGIVKELEIPKPPLPLQEKFVSIVNQIERVKITLESSKDELVNLSNRLSQKALKGELEINYKVFINGSIKVEPKISGEVIAIDKINKELEAFHKSQPHTGAPNEIDNTIRQLEAELKLKGEIPFWDEYVKYRIVKDKFKETFTFDQLWEEITKFPFETIPEYNEVATLLFKWLAEENAFIRQQFNESTKQIELALNETTTA